MKKIHFFLFPAALVFSNASLLFAGFLVNPSETGSQFLTMPVSARSVALGDGLSGLAGDIHSFEYNPASLSSLKEYQLTFTRSLLYQGTNMTSFGLALEPYKAFGFGLQYRRFGTSDVTRDDNGFETGEDVSVSDNGVSFGGSYLFRNIVSLGYGIEYIRRNLYRTSANAINHSAGMQFYFFGGKHVIGLSVQNLGQPVTFISAEEKMPIVFRLGGSHQVGRKKVEINRGDRVTLDSRLKVLWELNQFRDSKRLSGSAGAEYRFIQYMVLRAGARYRRDWQLSSGFGFRWKNYDIDYAVQNRSEIGLAHSFSVLMRWGKDDEDFDAD